MTIPNARAHALREAKGFMHDLLEPTITRRSQALFGVELRGSCGTTRPILISNGSSPGFLTCSDHHELRDSARH